VVKEKLSLPILLPFSAFSLPFLLFSLPLRLPSAAGDLFVWSNSFHIVQNCYPKPLKQLFSSMRQLKKRFFDFGNP